MNVGRHPRIQEVRNVRKYPANTRVDNLTASKLSSELQVNYIVYLYSNLPTFFKNGHYSVRGISSECECIIHSTVQVLPNAVSQRLSRYKG